MLETFLQKLTEDLLLEEIPQEQEGKRFVVTISPELSLVLLKEEAGTLMLGKIGAPPKSAREEFFILLMKGNFLGQGTGGAAIGLGSDENFLTLSQMLPYDINYPMFKDGLEDFVNYLAYWKEELVRHNETRIE